MNYNKAGVHKKGGSSKELPYETVYQIAKMKIVDKMTPAAISRELGVPYALVLPITTARKQHDLWISAIGSLGRQGLIND